MFTGPFPPTSWGPYLNLNNRGRLSSWGSFALFVPICLGTKTSSTSRLLPNLKVWLNSRQSLYLEHGMEFSHQKKATKRSPLRMRPLRLPGQSLQDEINRQADEALEYMILMALALLIAVMEWLRWFFRSPPHPFIPTLRKRPANSILPEFSTDGMIVFGWSNAMAPVL